MEQVFKALEELHPGCEVIDFRISFNYASKKQLSPNFYSELAEAIRNSEKIDIESVFGVHSS